MSFVLNSVEVSNIRSHEHFKIEPLTDGVTALVGPSGSGKSTVVDSIAWALFGTKPLGVSKNSSLIRIGAELPGDKVWVKVELSFVGFVMKVERRIVNKGGSTECDVWEKNDDETDFRHVAGPAVSHSESYLRRRLRMDESGFLSAFFIQQKRVDQLISATPRERAEVIEKLTGVSAITNALSEAKTEYSNSKKNLNSVDDYDVDAAERRRRELEKTSLSLEKKREQLGALDERLKEERSKTEELKTKLLEVESVFRRSKEIEVSLSHAQNLHEELKDRLNVAQQSKSRVKGELNSVELVTDITKVREKRDELSRELRKVVTSRIELERTRRERELRRAKAQSFIENSDTKDRASFEKEVEQYRSRLEMLTDTILKTKESLDSETAMFSVKKKQLETVSSLEGECPTCLQPVTDSEHVAHELEEEILGSKKRIGAIKSRLDDLQEQQVRADSVGERLKELEFAFDEWDATVEPEGEKSRLDELNESANHLESVSKELEHSVSKFEQIESFRTEYDRLRTEVESLSDRIEKGNLIVEELEKELGELGPQVTEESIEKLKARIEKHDAQLRSTEERGNQLKVDISVLGEREIHLTRQVEKDEEDAKKNSERLREIESKASTVELLDEFRKNRVRKSVPVVSTYASSLLSKFSDGAFTRLDLDEKFSATITRKDGEKLPVGLLSGGELSLAAISLRIAISLLLSGNSTRSCLVLDEILVSQDSTRSELTLSTLREVCKGQVILISHGSNTTDIADKVIELGRENVTE